MSAELLSRLATASHVWLPVTLATYYTAVRLQAAARGAPLLNPTLLTIAVVSAVLVASGVPQAAYFQSVSIIHYLLGTAVVALAVPLYRNLKMLPDASVRLAIGLLAGSLTSIVIGLAVAALLGASVPTLLSIVPKSATAAVSMDIARAIGGIPAAAAILTILTGIVGAALGPYVLNFFGVSDPAARGVALGTVSHGIATARALSEGEQTGCWAGLAMAANAILTAMLVPPLAHLWELLK
jgi:predicted murein hydrolase (TIGR00659 family)